MEKFKKVIDAIGIPRLIVSCFFLAIVIVAYVNGIDVKSYFSSTLKYWGMWGVLVLAMIPTIKCGIGPNFGVSLGIVCGLLGTLLSIEFKVMQVVDGILPGFGAWGAFAFAAFFSLMCTILKTPLLHMLGSTDATMKSTADYMFWTVSCGAIPAIVNMVMSYMVRSEGNALHASIGSMSGCILNIILDPIFILPWGLNMGAAGAGCAVYQRFLC